MVSQKIENKNIHLSDEPKLMGYFFHEKNLGYNPKNILTSSHIKIWWKCDKGPDHIWQESVRNWSRRENDCPFCANRKLSITNSLFSLYPNLAKEFHPTKNKGLKPDQLIITSRIKVWWKCDKGTDHEWQTAVRRRTIDKTGCPFCSGRKVSYTNSLLTKYPKIAKQWFYEKNGDLTPDKVVAASGKRFWWKCDKGPDHVWLATPDQRIKKTGCPFCSGKKVSATNSLATLYPDVAKQWHPTKNGTLAPQDVVCGSRKVVWWKCDKGSDHEWQTPIFRRTGAHSAGCPYCARQKLSKTNSLAALFPHLKNEWDYSHNNKLTPEMVMPGSSKRVWWICKNNSSHKWRTPIKKRTYEKSQCPWCNLAPRSKAEIYLAFELLNFLNFDINKHKIKIDNEILDCDILIDQLNLIIEYDGAYWHKQKEEIDYRKTMILENAGWTVIRIREKPLPKIRDMDIIVIKNDIKQTANILLKRIQDAYKISFSNLKKYINRKTLINKKEADSYINRLLQKTVEKNI
jgi:very-short-patch-repair endonuclease